MDDILVFTDTNEECQEHMKQVLEQMMLWYGGTPIYFPWSCDTKHMITTIAPPLSRDIP